MVSEIGVEKLSSPFQVSLECSANAWYPRDGGDNQIIILKEAAVNATQLWQSLQRDLSSQSIKVCNSTIFPPSLRPHY